MEAQTIDTANKQVQVRAGISWDEYFPLINKAIVGLLLIVALLIGSGVDLAQLGSRFVGSGDDVEAIVPVDAGESVAVNFSLTPKPTAKGLDRWRHVIVAVAMMLGVVVLVLYVLSVGGRDAERMKEQVAAIQREKDAKKPEKSSDQPAAPEETECNLATYKMFYSSEKS